MSVGPATNCSKHARDRPSDPEIYQSNQTWHTQACTKRGNDVNLWDKGDGVGDYSDRWAMLLEKGYQGVKELTRGILFFQKPVGRLLSLQEERYNKKVSFDMVIVENVFGRLVSLYGVIFHKWK